MNSQPTKPPSGKTGARWLFYFIAGIVVVGLIVIAIPSFVRARVTESFWSCQSNLSQIDGALQQHARDRKLKAGDTVPLADLRPYYQDQKIFETHTVCLAGGIYPTTLVVGQEPSCALLSTNPALHARQWDEAWKRRSEELRRWQWKWPN